MILAQETFPCSMFIVMNGSVLVEFICSTAGNVEILLPSAYKPLQWQLSDSLDAVCTAESIHCSCCWIRTWGGAKIFWGGFDYIHA